MKPNYLGLLISRVKKCKVASSGVNGRAADA